LISKVITMDMIGRIRRLQEPEEEVGARDRAHHGAVAQHGLEVAARRGRRPAEVPARRAAGKLTAFHDALGRR
jgi:hypothetical protein